MNKNQKEIIKLLKEEFERINDQKIGTSKFNLIDVSPLIELSEKKRLFREEQEILEKTWEKIAEDECYRIIDLLKQDLPNAFIEKMGASNSHLEYNNILIGYSLNSLNGHWENRIDIGINKFVEQFYDSELGEYFYKYKGLKYKFKNYVAETIEGLFNCNELKEELRMKLKL
jgi:hypothetical protein